MSIVSSYTSPHVEEALRRQRRSSSVTSIIAAILALVLMALILALIFLPGFFVESPTIVAYRSATQDDDVVDRPEMNTQVQRKPSAPSSSMAKVIASTTPTPTAIPVPEVLVPEPSMDFGNGNDFGDGWGSGSGSGAGGTTFFGQKVRADRIAYVIDYSASMKGSREKLMRKELSQSVNKIMDGVQFALVFFAGPAWVAGDKLQGKNDVTVIAKGGHKYKWKNRGGAHGFEHDGRKQPVEWVAASGKTISKTQKIVQETRLVWGTVWDNPLNMALDMEPPPQTIYFMTDGAAKGSNVWAKDVGDRARKMGVVINCIAMMQPRAHADLDDLAKRAGGQFTIVHDGGKREKVR